MQDKPKPITSRLCAMMRESQQAYTGAQVVDMPRDVFEQECGIIDGAYAALERELERAQSERPDLDGYLLLPRDADGEVCRVGDRMEWHDQRFRVAAINDGGWLWYVTADGKQRMALARDCHHESRQTVDGVRGESVSDAHDFCRRLEAAAAEREDVTIFGVDYVALPLDADGVPIHVRDVMVYVDGDACPMPAIAIVSSGVFLTDEGPRFCDMCRHYHEPTVEDVLEEFVARWMETHHDDMPALKAEYADRLREVVRDE